MTQIHTPNVATPAPPPYDGLRVGRPENILPLTKAPHYIEGAISGATRSRIPLPPAEPPEPEQVETSATKAFAYRAFVKIIEYYWTELLAWRRAQPHSLGLVLPSELKMGPSFDEFFRSELLKGASLSAPGSISTNLMSRVRRVTSSFASPPRSECWRVKAENEPESVALAAHLMFTSVEARLTAGLNSAFARTFEIQAQLLDSLGAAAQGSDLKEANAALSVLSSPEALAHHMGELHKLLRYFSSLHSDHFKVVNDWMREQPGASGAFRFLSCDENPRGAVGFPDHALADLHRRIGNCVPTSSRHGCPASASRTALAPGQEMASVLSQTFTWIQEINAAFLFPLVVELYSREAPSAETSL